MGFGDFLSSLGSAIGSACSMIGETLGKVGKTIAQTAIKILPMAEMVVNVVRVVAQVCSVLQKDDKVEELGSAMRQSQSKPEDFDSINDYINHLREEIREGSVDVKPTGNEIQDWADKAMGCSLVIQGINEKYKVATTPDFWMTMGKKFGEGKIDEKEVDGILKKSSQTQIDPEDVKNYINHDEIKGDSPKGEISSVIIDGLKEAQPQASQDQITQRFNELVKKD